VPSAHASKSSPAGATTRPVGDAPSIAEPTLASDLGEQNDGFHKALEAKKRGAKREALAAFDAFVARYPSSPLVESALAQRMQLLRTMDSVRARAAAEQYLGRYPRGFAASEAESIRRASP